MQLDSDVSQNERNPIYQNCKFELLLTTPDLIHFSLHKLELRMFIAATKIIVFAEIHTYTGMFGTHIYYFLRRLSRVLIERKNIQYIVVFVTIANPVEFTSKLFDGEMIHIDYKTPKKNTPRTFWSLGCTNIFCFSWIACEFG